MYTVFTPRITNGCEYTRRMYYHNIKVKTTSLLHYVQQTVNKTW
jgi:hypothetical protein